jgi:histidinol-phosphate phosphatase family protein
MKKRKPAILLDRDGTILNERGYLASADDMKFYPNVFKPLARLGQAGYPLVLITNQSGVARGLFTIRDLKKVNRAFARILKRHGVRLAGIYFCPHMPRAGCSCRKPKPGLAKRAARDLGLDLKRSFMIGDQVRDIQFANNIGAKGILVLTGSGREWRKKALRARAKVTSNLATASAWILSQ